MKIINIICAYFQHVYPLIINKLIERISSIEFKCAIIIILIKFINYLISKRKIHQIEQSNFDKKRLCMQDPIDINRLCNDLNFKIVSFKEFIKFATYTKYAIRSLHDNGFKYVEQRDWSTVYICGFKSFPDLRKYRNWLKKYLLKNYYCAKFNNKNLCEYIRIGDAAYADNKWYSTFDGEYHKALVFAPKIVCTCHNSSK